MFIHCYYDTLPGSKDLSPTVWQGRQTDSKQGNVKICAMLSDPKNCKEKQLEGVGVLRRGGILGEGVKPTDNGKELSKQRAKPVQGGEGLEV